jgi:hypothetical protein
MDVAAIVVAILAAAVSFSSAVYTTRLQSRLAEESREKSKAEQLKELMGRYRDPLLHSAFELQSRLYNIAKLEFLDNYHRDGKPDEKAYAVDNTLYVIGEYLGWVEIMRREVRFLDLGDELKNRDWNECLLGVREAFLDTGIGEPVLRLFKGEQRAIGEVMIREEEGEGNRGLECIGYAEFVARLEDPSFNRWFTRLRGDIEALLDEGRRVRLVALQNALIALVDQLDPRCVYFKPELRQKLEPAGEAPPA